MSDDLAGAGITAKERLQNIEAVLVKIDSKLDGKADQADLVALEGRVREMEMRSTRVERFEEEVHAIRENTEQSLQEVSNGLSVLQKKLAYYAGGIAVAVFLVESAISILQITK